MKLRESQPSPKHKDGGKPAHRLLLAVHPGTGRRFVPFLRRHLLAAHGLLRPALRELSLALVGDNPMSLLHKRFMNIEGPTDVLTFPLDFDAAGRVTAGEVVICVPEAARQARLRGIEVREELLLYALHGMLHLSGFDDRTDTGFRQMHRKEDDILGCLGLGPVFRMEAPVARRNRRGNPARSASRSSAKRTRAVERIGVC